MITVFVHQNGQTQAADRVEPQWLDAASGVTLWVDLMAPGDAERRVLGEVFGFHPLSVDDAVSALQFPKIETYPGYLYVVLHGIDAKLATPKPTGGGGPQHTHLSTRDVDFFLGRNYLVTVHDGDSRSINAVRDVCGRHEHVLKEGPVSLMHRIIDRMIDNYRPVFEEIESRIGRLEEQAFAGHERMSRHVMKLKRDVSAMRRVLVPQRDAIGRLARREFSTISDEMTYRFRDVYDHVVRLTEEAVLFQDRVTGIFEVNLSTVSYRLNQVMKLLTVMSTIFLPLTVLTGMWGMNIPLPHFPGGPEVQFWWVSGIMVALIAGMLVFFRRNKWI
jgi:magnesium transporter